jgi:hypothetical protein
MMAFAIQEELPTTTMACLCASADGRGCAHYERAFLSSLDVRLLDGRLRIRETVAIRSAGKQRLRGSFHFEAAGKREH